MVLSQFLSSLHRALEERVETGIAAFSVFQTSSSASGRDVEVSSFLGKASGTSDRTRFDLYYLFVLSDVLENRHLAGSGAIGKPCRSYRT